MTSHEQFTKRCSPSLNIQKKKRGLYLSTQLSGCMWTWKFCLTAYKGFLKISRCKCQMWVTTLPGLAWPGLATTRIHQCSLEVSVRFWCWLQRNHSWSEVWMCLGVCQCSSLGMLVTPQTIKSMFYSTRPLCGGFCCCVRFFKYKVLQTKTERILSSAV